MLPFHTRDRSVLYIVVPVVSPIALKYTPETLQDRSLWLNPKGQNKRNNNDTLNVFLTDKIHASKYHIRLVTQHPSVTLRSYPLCPTSNKQGYNRFRRIYLPANVTPPRTTRPSPHLETQALSKFLPRIPFQPYTGDNLKSTLSQVRRKKCTLSDKRPC